MITVMKFSAEWCIPCKKYDPILDKLEKQRDDVVVERYDIEEKADMAVKYDIQTVPTTVFKDENGTIIGKVTGAKTLKDLNKLIDSLVDKPDEE